MHYRKLPQADLEISEIGFGCMSLDLNQTTNEVLLQEAVDHGINYFDTADLYDRGKNEEVVGKALKSVRNKVIIATKVGNEWLPDWSNWRWNPSKGYILKAVEKSLQRLQTDYIDIYQLHGGTIDDPMDEVIDAFETLKRDGKIRYYGISSIRPNVIKAYAGKTGIVSDMIQYSLLDRRPEEEALRYLQEHGVGVMVRGTLAKGLLAGKDPASYLSFSESEVNSMLDCLHIYKSDKRTLAQTAIKYVLHHKAVTSAIIGIRTRAQLEEAVETCHAPNLSQLEIKEIRGSLKPIVYTDHRE